MIKALIYVNTRREEKTTEAIYLPLQIHPSDLLSMLHMEVI